MFVCSHHAVIVANQCPEGHILKTSDVMARG